MPSTFTPQNRLELQNPGENLNTWGAKLNADTTALIDFAISGVTPLTLSGPITLTTLNGAPDQGRSAILNFTSGTGGTVTVPSASHVYQIRNNCSGNLVFTTGSGTTATVEPGNFATVIGDGTNCYRFSDAADIAASLVAAKAYTDAAAFSSASGNLPGQTGNAGKFLQTNGTTPSWLAISSLNVTTALGFTPQAALGFTPLNLASNLSDVANVGTSRTNLGLGTAAVANTGTSGALVPLLNGANVWSANQIIRAASPVLDGAATTVRAIYYTTANLNRWSVYASGDAESGANAGTLFEVGRWSDAGSYIDSPFTINRATGLVTISDGLVVVGVSTLSGAQTTPVAVTFNATAMTVNCALSNVFTTTFTANVTSAPTLSNPGDGQTVNWFITQDGAGSRTMTWPASFKWVNGSASILSTAPSSVDMLVATYRAATGLWYASLAKGFA